MSHEHIKHLKPQLDQTLPKGTSRLQPELRPQHALADLRQFLHSTQNHRMVGVGRDLCGSPSPTPCRSRVTHSRLHRTLSRRVWNISREGDSTTSLGSSRAPSPSEGRSSASCSAGTSSALVCARCPLSCCWAPLKRAWPHPPDTHPADIYKHL